MLKRFKLIAFVLIITFGCTNQKIGQRNQAVHPQYALSSDRLESECLPTDQDAYVWVPRRLQVLHSCVRATGTVMALSGAEPDGDLHIYLQLDTPFQSLLTTGNQYVNGYLIIEAVCQYIPPMLLALRTCASDPDPYLGPYPHIGDHIWVEGRYILDMWHHAWAEFHPLYRWGIASQ